MEFKAQFQSLCKLLEQPAISAGVQLVGRQSGKPSGEIVSGGRRKRQIQLVQLSAPREVNMLQLGS